MASKISASTPSSLRVAASSDTPSIFTPSREARAAAIAATSPGRTGMRSSAMMPVTDRTPSTEYTRLSFCSLAFAASSRRRTAQSLESRVALE